MFALINFDTSKNNIEFKATQVEDILLWNWFLVNTTPILPESDKEEEEGVTILVTKAHATWTSKIPRACFWCAPIDLNKETKDVKKIGGMNTQLETYR